MVFVEGTRIPGPLQRDPQSNQEHQEEAFPCLVPGAWDRQRGVGCLCRGPTWVSTVLQAGVRSILQSFGPYVFPAPPFAHVPIFLWVNGPLSQACSCRASE